MSAKFEIGQKVLVKPVSDQALSLRDAALESFEGQAGEIVSFYSVSPAPGQVFYIYTVRVGSGSKRVVLHEDEIEVQMPQPSSGGRRRR